jgi:RimJ/RimL family protein N-acetyltransferase
MVPTPYPDNGAMHWYSAVAPRIAAGRASIFAVTQEGEFRGIVSINQINRTSRSAELDYWIAHDWHAQGLGTRAVALAIAHAFNRLEVHTLDNVCLAENLASIRVLEKNGFSRIGSALMPPGRFCGAPFNRYRNNLHAPD